MAEFSFQDELTLEAFRNPIKISLSYIYSMYVLKLSTVWSLDINKKKFTILIICRCFNYFKMKRNDYTITIKIMYNVLAEKNPTLAISEWRFYSVLHLTRFYSVSYLIHKGCLVICTSIFLNNTDQSVEFIVAYLLHLLCMNWCSEQLIKFFGCNKWVIY